MKKILLIALAMLFVFTMQAEQVVINVTTPGTLEQLIAATGKTNSELTDLKITGSINGDDIGAINLDYRYNYTDLGYMLVSLDLSEANIVAGGVYYTDGAKTDYVAEADCLGDHMFALMKNLKHLKLPKSLKKIGDYALTSAASLETVTIGDNVTSIGERTFNNCSSLQQVVIPNNVTQIGLYAFCMCSALESVTIGKSVTSMAKYAFIGCSSLKEITCLSTTPPVLGSEDVFDSDVLNSAKVIVPVNAKDTYSSDKYWGLFTNIEEEDKTVEELIIEMKEAGTISAEVAGIKLSGVKKLTISGPINSDDVPYLRSMTNLQEADMSGLTVEKSDNWYEVKFDNGGNSIFWSENNRLPDYLFNELSSLTNITLPTSITAIGQCALFKTSLTEIIIPEGVTEIGIHGVSNISTLTKIVLPSTLTTIGAFAFVGTETEDVKSIDLPEGLKTIGFGAFWGQTKLTHIDIPSSVELIGSYAFCECPLSTINSYATTAPKCEGTVEDEVAVDVFDEDVIKNAKLNIPVGSKSSYKTADVWKEFFTYGNVSESLATGTTTGIHSAIKTSEATITDIYGLDGRQVSSPQKGVNIIRYSNGQTRKVAVE